VSKRTKSLLVTGSLIGLASAVGIIVDLAKSPANLPSPAQTLVDPVSLPNLKQSLLPWSTQTGTLKDRLNIIGLSALNSEGTTLHIHQHLDLYINGQAVTVPQDIGINNLAGFISPIHTHDTTGIIHVESPTVQTFTLGQFFDIWGVRFTDTCIGGYCNQGDNKLKVFSNGQELQSGFRFLPLTAHQEIVVRYGSNNQTPSPVPTAYNFPPNY